MTMTTQEVLSVWVIDLLANLNSPPQIATEAKLMKMSTIMAKGTTTTTTLATKEMLSVCVTFHVFTILASPSHIAIIVFISFSLTGLRTLQSTTSITSSCRPR